MRIEEYDDGYDSAASFEAAGADRPEDMEPAEHSGHLPLKDGEGWGPYAPRRHDRGGYLECDMEYALNNLELAVKLLDNYGNQWHGCCEEDVPK